MQLEQEVKYKREGEVENTGYGRKKPGPIVGAYLVEPPCSAFVPKWRISCDVNEMLSHPTDQVIFADSEEAIQAALEGRYPAEADCSLVTRSSSSSWEIERHPLLKDDMATLQTLAAACALYGKVLVSNQAFNKLGRGSDLAREGFVAEARSSRRACLVRYNPRTLRIRRWKTETTEVQKFLQPKLPGQVVNRLFQAMLKASWRRSRHGTSLQFTGKVSTYQIVEGKTRRRRRVWGDVTEDDAPAVFLRAAEICRLLNGGRPVWRRKSTKKNKDVNPHEGSDVGEGPFRRELANALKYIHGIELKEASKDWKRLALWMRREAKALRLKVPPKPNLPPKPTFKKRAQVHKRKGDCRGNPIAGRFY
jgi:hypothetical protein